MEVCSCGSKTKSCIQNGIEGNECISCGKRLWSNKVDALIANDVWVKLSKKKPPLNALVLFFSPASKAFISGFFGKNKMNDKDYFYQNGNCMEHTITHWTKLPKKPYEYILIDNGLEEGGHYEED